MCRSSKAAQMKSAGWQSESKSKIASTAKSEVWKIKSTGDI